MIKNLWQLLGPHVFGIALVVLVFLGFVYFGTDVFGAGTAFQP